MAKILLVEDDNNLREIYEARLQAEGYTIVSAKDGEEALVLAKAEHPDLIISDVMMPRVSGFEMLDILRNTEGLKDTKIIMLTALGQAEDKTRADSLGADSYLVKSQVTLEDIVKTAQDLLVKSGAATAPATQAPAPAASTPAPATPAATAPVAVTPAPSANPTPASAPKPASQATTPIATPIPVASPPVASVSASMAPPSPSPASAPSPAAPSLQPPEPTAPAPAPEPPATPSPTPPTPTEPPQPPAPATNMTPAAPSTPPSAPAVPPHLTQPVSAPAQPTPVAATPSAPAAPVVEPKAAAAAQSTSNEEAAMQAQIKDFVNRPDTSALAVSPAPPPVSNPASTPSPELQKVPEATPAPPTPAPVVPPPNINNQETDQQLVAAAVKNLSGGGTPTPAPVTSPAPVVEPPQPAPVTTAPTAPVTVDESEGENENDDSVTVAHKKIIKPIVDPTVQTKPDLNELLAREGIANIDDLPHQPATPSSAAPTAYTTPHPPGHVITPNGGNAGGVDPNSIAL